MSMVLRYQEMKFKILDRVNT